MAIVTFDDQHVQRAWELFQVYLPLLFNTKTGIIGWIPCGYFEGGTIEENTVVLVSLRLMTWVIKDYHNEPNGEPLGAFDLEEMLRVQFASEEVHVDFRSEKGRKLNVQTPFRHSTEAHEFFVAKGASFKKFFHDVLALELGGSFGLDERQRQDLQLRIGRFELDESGECVETI